ncbi:MAG: efflux RND transporter permease subunit [Chloroflexota bacterium]
MRVFGDDPNTLIDLANQVEAVMETVPGTADILNLDAARSPETSLIVDRDQALALGLSPAQIATTLRAALSGSNVGQFTPAGDTEIDMVLRLQETSRADLESLLQLPLGYVNGEPIRLERVAEVERTLAPARITRADRQRILTIGSGVSGRAAGDVTNDVETAINEQVDFPVGYGFRFVGTAEVQRESFADLGSAILLAIVLIYMLLVGLYQSFLQPLAIMFSLPVALVGAIGGLWLTDNTLNLISLLGVVLLTGVVTKNAIIIVDFTNTLREREGYSTKEALVNAGRLRLRAVLMTTLTLVFALFPLLLGAGAGSENRAPLAAVVMGGVVSSTMLTLILVPVVYNFFDWISNLFARIFRFLIGADDDYSDPDPEKTDAEPAPDKSPSVAPSQPVTQPGAAISQS